MKTITNFFLASALILFTAFSANAQCTSGFTWNQPSNNVIDFTNTSTPIIPNSTFFFWDFGDQQYDYTQSPSHTFTIPGTYTVCVTMMDSISQCTSQFCDVVTVTGTVICNLTVNATLVSNASCPSCYDGSATAVISGGTAPYTYMWSNNTNSQTATGLGTGTYTVCVTDANGCNACDTITISVGSQSSCNANYTWSQTINNVIDFDASSSTGLTASTTYYWDFGDNVSYYAVSSTVSHTYQNPGTYIACLTIYDSTTQCSSTFCDSVTVFGNNINTPCHAAFSIYMDSINPQQAWIWNTSTGGSGMTFTWFWGDNTSDTGMFASHIYNQTGSYNICLVVTDTANQCSDTTCQLLMVPRMTQQTASQPFYVNCLGATGIQQHDLASVFNIYPNPAESEINIKTNYSLQGKNFRVNDISGREVMSGKLNGNTINVTSLEKGMYMLQIENAEGGFSAQRFMKD